MLSRGFMQLILVTPTVLKAVDNMQIILMICLITLLLSMLNEHTMTSPITYPFRDVNFGVAIPRS